MKRLLLALFLLLSIAGCTTMGSNTRELAGLIPGETDLYLQITHPRLFFEELEGFSEATGLKNAMGGVTMKNLINLVLNISRTGLSLSWMDMEKPIGLGITDLEQPVPRIIIYLPLTEEKYFDKLNSIASDIGLAMKRAGGYALLSTSEELLARPASGIELTDLEKYGTGSLYYYASSTYTTQSLTSLIDTWDMLTSEITMSVDEDEMEMLTRESTRKSLDLFKGLIMKMQELYKDIESMTAAYHFTKEGLILKSYVSFDENSTMGQWCRKVEAAGPISERLKEIPRGSLFSYAQNLDYSLLIPATEAMMEVIYDVYELDEEVQKEYKELMEKMLTYYGSWMSFYMDMETTPGGSFSPEDIINNLNFTAGGVMDMNQGKELDALMNELYTSSFMDRLLDQLLGFTGMNIKMIYKKDLDAGGMKYSTLNYQVSFPPEVMEEETVEIMKQMLERMTFYFHYTDTRFYFYMGKKGPEGLKEVINNSDAGQDSFAGAPEIETFSKIMSSDSQIFFNYSISEIISMSLETQGLKLEITDAPGFLGAVKIDGNRWESTGFISSSELAQYIKLGQDAISRGVQSLM